MTYIEFILPPFLSAEICIFHGGQRYSVEE